MAFEDYLYLKLYRFEILNLWHFHSSSNYILTACFQPIRSLCSLFWPMRGLLAPSWGCPPAAAPRPGWDKSSSPGYFCFRFRTRRSSASWAGWSWWGWRWRRGPRGPGGSWHGNGGSVYSFTRRKMGEKYCLFINVWMDLIIIKWMKWVASDLNFN